MQPDWVYNEGVVLQISQIISGWDWHALTSSCRSLRRYACNNSHLHISWKSRSRKTPVFPLGVTSVTPSRTNFYKMLCLPDSVKRLRLETFYTDHVGLIIPESVQDLEVDMRGVRQSIGTWVKPRGLKKLTTTRLAPYTWLPDGIEALIITESFQATWLHGPWILPKGLKYLDMGDISYVDVTFLVLPEGLLHLKFNGNGINEADWTLPESLQVLEIGGTFYKDVQCWKLPRGLKTLSLGDHFNSPLNGLVFPDALESLSLGAKFNQDLDQVRWPPNLKELKILSWFSGDLLIPSSLVRLVICEDYIWPENLLEKLEITRIRPKGNRIQSEISIFGLSLNVLKYRS